MGILGCIKRNSYELRCAGLFPGIPIASVVVLSYGLFYSNNQNDYRSELIEQINIRADKDKNGVVSTEEMGEVYNYLGLKLNEVSPKRLSISDLEKYLEIKK